MDTWVDAEPDFPPTHEELMKRYPPKMILRITRNRKTIEIPVETVNQASAIWLRTFDEMLANGEDMIPNTCRVLIVDGKVRGYVSQNGKVWEGAPKSWYPGQKPLFDPAAL